MAIFFNRAFISWEQNMQGFVALSSIEAEYGVCSKTGKEVMHIRRMLDFVSNRRWRRRLMLITWGLWSGL